VRRRDMTHERREVVDSITTGRGARAACLHHGHAALNLPLGRRRCVTAQPWPRKQQRGQRLRGGVAASARCSPVPPLQYSAIAAAAAHGPSVWPRHQQYRYHGQPLPLPLPVLWPCLGCELGVAGDAVV